MRVSVWYERKLSVFILCSGRAAESYVILLWTLAIVLFKKVLETRYVYVIGYEISYSVGATVERGSPSHWPSLVTTQRKGKLSQITAVLIES
jgi:hypothetical protein